MGVKTMRAFLSLLFILLPALSSADAPAVSQRARIDRLENTFLAPCCYAEPVSRHRSDVALQMKAEIGRWVAEGKSDREIIDTYKQRYGTQVLVEPEGAPWWWMHVIPWVVLAMGLALTLWVVRRMHARRAAAPAAPADSALFDPDTDWDI